MELFYDIDEIFVITLIGLGHYMVYNLIATDNVLNTVASHKFHIGRNCGQ